MLCSGVIFRVTFECERVKIISGLLCAAARWRDFDGTDDSARKNEQKSKTGISCRAPGDLGRNQPCDPCTVETGRL